MSTLYGGNFGNGFVAAGVAEALGPMIDTIGDGAPSYAPARVAVAALVGGTASVITGGKFANGAITAAFSRAFNEEIDHSFKFKAAVKAKIGSYLNAAIEQNAQLKMDIADADAVDIEMSRDGTGIVSVGGNKFKFTYDDPFSGLQGYVREFSIRSATFGVGVTNRGNLSIQAGFSSSRYVPAVFSKYVNAGVTISMEVSPVDIVVNNTGLLGNAARTMMRYQQRYNACINSQESGTYGPACY